MKPGGCCSSFQHCFAKISSLPSWSVKLNPKRSRLRRPCTASSGRHLPSFISASASATCSSCKFRVSEIFSSSEPRREGRTVSEHDLLQGLLYRRGQGLIIVTCSKPICRFRYAIESKPEEFHTHHSMLLWTPLAYLSVLSGNSLMLPLSWLFACLVSMPRTLLVLPQHLINKASPKLLIIV